MREGSPGLELMAWALGVLGVCLLQEGAVEELRALLVADLFFAAVVGETAARLAAALPASDRERKDRDEDEGEAGAA